MPEHEGIVKLVTGTYINYFHCQKIVSILEKTEANSKNLFGRYGSQRMKDWKEIIRLYEKDNLYLAEAAQILIRNINYEIPSLKKQIHKLDQTKRDLEKNIAEYKKSEIIAQSEFNTLCKNLGITGQDIKKELAERIVVLPKIYDTIVKKCQALSNVITFYEAFASFTLGGKSDRGCVPIIQYVIEKGNTTTYEWIYGEVPDSIVELLLKHTLTDVEESSSIDFGDTDDYLSSLNNSSNVNDNIEFDFNTDDSVFISNKSGNIDEEISLEESGIVVESISLKNGIATGNEALRILDNSKTRDEFIDQLLELEAFLKLRLYELKNERQGHPNMSQIQESSTILQLSSLDSIQNMLDNVQIVLSAILDNQVQHLHRIKHSHRYLDVLSEMIEQKRGMMEKMIAIQQKNVEKQNEVTREINDLQPLLNIVIQRTKELRTDIERDISKKYQSRPVQLTGIINHI
ncbi:Similar to Cdk5rap3: CDK5 regulatory subunit-associated protein 3 (Rattus norvegicus) [Cotesia congregata]|uniref:Similar to Cdk5rap3: CDK5 regulatory subunit-associated protein 3 (Rattus norvegicus) n=1 Tax=Cotesia congregata TaxID=51543 RepID=A0A8J2GZE5_COTCN|nr:Similar to Cdk5rap3: CDK5 regulatory subunit-associated protein 3 (Rattus norvegicus) [Cotesia congregata]